MKVKIMASDFYRLCNKHGLFKRGTTWQYDRAFELIKEGVTRMELACVLFVCSDYKLDEIREWIAPLFKGGQQNGI